MPICIECHYPVSQLYQVSHSSNASNSRTSPSASPPALPGIRVRAAETGTGAATSRFPDAGGAVAKGSTKKEGGSGGDVRLTQCARCKRFADKYVEHDFVVLFIDLVLVKPQVRSRLTHQFVIRSNPGLPLPFDCLQMQPDCREEWSGR